MVELAPEVMVTIDERCQYFWRPSTLELGWL